MISINTLLNGLLVINMLLVMIAALVIFKKRLKGWFVVSQLLVLVGYVSLFGYVCTIGNVVGYIGGTEVTDIKEVRTDTESGYYIARTASGNKYKTIDCIEGKETKVVEDCKVLQSTVFGFNTYRNGIVIVMGGRTKYMDNTDKAVLKTDY